ncbi:MAG: response regulator transcription factor [Flavobacteriales bacterium]
MDNTRILLVEDDENFGALLRDYLQMNGFQVFWYTSGFQALSFFRKEGVDLCITDVMMPKMSGFEFAEQLREFDLEIPLIFLTARNQKEDQIKGFRLGADDYLCKPFDSELLLMKIGALLKRSIKVEIQQNSYSVGQFSFNVSSRKLVSDSTVKRLSPKESALFEMLCANKNEILMREKALMKIWKDDTYFTRRSMDVYIAKLRKYIRSDENLSIENLHSQGYILKEFSSLQNN